MQNNKIPERKKVHNLIQVRWPALQRHGQKFPKKKEKQK